MLKHLALVEDDWFQVKFLGVPELEPWASAPFDVDLDWDWHSAVDDTPDELLRLYDAACTHSRAGVAEVGGDLDRRSAIEETAPHNGHADLLREAIDGSVGEWHPPAKRSTTVSADVRGSPSIRDGTSFCLGIRGAPERRPPGPAAPRQNDHGIM